MTKKNDIGDEAHRQYAFRPANRSLPLSALILALARILLDGMGLYFIFVRPPLLPEDMRYIGLPAAQLEIVRLNLEAWLRQVFLVLGGYVLATGILAITLATTSFRAHHWGAAVGATIGGAASIGTMAVVNFTIDSDFKWVIFFTALLWASSLGLFWFETKGSVENK